MLPSWEECTAGLTGDMEKQQHTLGGNGSKYAMFSFRIRGRWPEHHGFPDIRALCFFLTSGLRRRRRPYVQASLHSKFMQLQGYRRRIVTDERRR